MYTVSQTRYGRWRVFNLNTQQFTRGNFHTEQQAQDWVDQQLVNRVLNSLQNRFSDPRRQNQPGLHYDW